MKKLATLGIVLALAAGVMAGCGGGGGASSGATKSVEMKALDTFKFEPNAIDANKGDTVHVKLTNTGSMQHDFTAPDLGVAQVVDAGKTVEFDIKADKAGAFDFYCNQPGHKDGGMTGKITVK